MGNEGERETEKKGRESGAEGKERKIQRKRKKVDRGGRSDEKMKDEKKDGLVMLVVLYIYIQIACVIWRACMSWLKHKW